MNIKKTQKLPTYFTTTDFENTSITVAPLIAHLIQSTLRKRQKTCTGDRTNPLLVRIPNCFRIEK